MVEYMMMREGSVLTSCLHGGPIPLAEVSRAEEVPSWLEREAQLPAGTVARMLNALCREYGSCGVMAVDGGAVVGKVRFAPGGLGENVPECVQQYAVVRPRAGDPALHDIGRYGPCVPLARRPFGYHLAQEPRMVVTTGVVPSV